MNFRLIPMLWTVCATACAVVVAAPSPALAQDIQTAKIGLSLPLTGRFAPVARQVEFGAMAAFQAHKNAGGKGEIVLFDDQCDPERAKAAATEFEQQNVSVITGPLCYAFAKSLALTLKENALERGADAGSTAIFTLATRNADLARARQVEELTLASISKAHDAEATAIVDLILPRIADRPFAILDDGSIYGRGLSDAVRLKAEQNGLKPVVTANFRPLQTSQRALLRRLARSGVEAVFVAASAEDIITIAKDMATLNMNWALAAGETARLLSFTPGATLLPEGLLAVLPAIPTITPGSIDISPMSDEEDKGQETLPLEGPVLLGYAAMEVALAVAQKPAAERTIAGASFDTLLGSLTFDESARAPAFPFQLMRWTNGAFEPLAAN
ncbi:MAG: ABC transporter substrate-binding protein [Pseudomonadota bacterium]